MYTYKGMVHPNNKQKTKLRLILNKCIECNILVHKYLDSFLESKKQIPKEDVLIKWWYKQKWFLDQKTKKDRENLTRKEIINSNLELLFNDIDSYTLNQEVRKIYDSYVKYSNGLASRPKPKQYNNYKKTFFLNSHKILFTDRKVKIENLTDSLKDNRQVIKYVSLARKNYIPLNVKYYSPKIVLEGDKFFIVVVVQRNFKKKELTVNTTSKSLGIDLNINNIVTSDQTFYESVTKQENYIKCETKLIKYQQILSKRYEDHKIYNTVLKTKTFYKIKSKKNKYQRKLESIQTAYYDTIILDIIKKGYKQINIEDLSIKDMKESYNKSKQNNLPVDNFQKGIAKGLHKNPFGKFIKRLELLTSKYGIIINKISDNYPSSKMCSCCGNIKKDLTLADRIYSCPVCGLTIDRDYNAAINIAKFK